MDVIEFFSGIGGMRLSLTDATKNLEEFPLGAFKAIDTSELVNQVYRHNFSNEEPWKINIETIKVFWCIILFLCSRHTEILSNFRFKTWRGKPHVGPCLRPVSPLQQPKILNNCNHLIPGIKLLFILCNL